MCCGHNFACSGENTLFTKSSQKMVSLVLDKPIFASSDARFCHNTRNDGRNTQFWPQNVQFQPCHGFVTLVCVYEA